MSTERVVVKFFGNGISVANKVSLFNRNVQNKHKNSECNSVIGFFNLRTNHLGRYRFGYLSKTQYGRDVTDVRRVSDGGYLKKKKDNFTKIHARCMKFSQLVDGRQRIVTV